MKRDRSKSRFKKVIGVTVEHYAYIVLNKGRKSIAGKLKEIIDEHIINNN
jgi:hypothetical protein